MPNVRDVVYETARQFSEIAASLYWIQQRIGDINLAAKEMKNALKAQQKYFNRALQIAEEKNLMRVTKKKKRRAKRPKAK